VTGDPNQVGPACDVYSLGVILYELLTGQVPYRGAITAVLGQIIQGKPRRPSELRPDLDKRLEAICLKLMAHRAQARYASAAEAVAALDRWLEQTSPGRSAGEGPATEAQRKLEDQKQQVLTLLKQCQFSEVLVHLVPLTRLQGPGTEPYVSWAQQELTRLKALPAEAPKHRVRITKPFWLGRHEVTRGQFRRFVEVRGYKTEAERDGKGGFGLLDGRWKQDPRFVWNGELGFEQADDHPVVNVTWNDVTAFCAWLSEKEGAISHLPTEAQWEYTCRAGATTMWYSGDDEGAFKAYAWYGANAGGKTHPVGQKSPNAWGLHDMLGNVWESCQDWFGERYYATSPLDDPRGEAGGSARAGRGGSWVCDACCSRTSYRNADPPGYRFGNRGFRLARMVSSSPASR
jgi:formylglycine-generating enzyme required for sulfatase activity